MNNFDQTFFKKYIASGQEIIGIFHRHFIKIIDDLILIFFLALFIPLFIYYNSYFLQEQIKFLYVEIYIFIIYFITIYKIFDWYNDVLILTNSGIVKLDWSLLKSNTITVDYEHIEGVEVEKNGFLDSILQKGDLIIHKFGEEEIIVDEVYKPYRIVDKIEEITSQIEHPEELDKFDLMMDTLSTIVRDFLEKNNKKKEDIFPKNIYENEEIQKEFLEKSNFQIQEKQDFLEKIKQEDGTIDLREKNY